MAGETLTTLDALTKNTYAPGLDNFINRRRPLAGRIKKNTDRTKFQGRVYIFAAQTENTQSYGPIAEDEVLPVGGNIEVINMQAALKYHYSVARITRQAAKLANSDKGAFKSSVATHLDSARDGLDEDLAINMTYGTGYGDIGTVSGYTSSTLTVVAQATNGGVGTRMIRKNMMLSSYSALSGGAQGADGKLVSAVPTSSTATVPTGAGFNTSDYLFRCITAGTDPRDKAIMGLGGLMDDGTRRGTIQNLSRTTYPSLKANLLGNSGTLRAWTSDLMDSAGVEGSQNGGGGYPTAFFSRIEIQQRAAAWLYADRKLTMQDMKLEGGWEAVAWKVPGKGTIPWFEDRYCRPNEVMAIDENALEWLIDEDVQFEEVDGAIWRFTDRKHTMEAWLYTWRNLISRQFNNHTVLRDISHTL